MTDSQPTTEQRIWQALSTVPAGTVVSYGQLAALAGLPGRARWVGSLLGKLPGDSRLPWHRVVKSQGQIAFAPASSAARRQIERLREEGVVITGHRINMSRYRWQP